MPCKDIYLYGPIGKGFDSYTGEAANSAKDLIAALPSGGPINLRINSDGGDVFEARAMVEALRRYEGAVTATVDAIAASAASFLLAGADEVLMAPGSMLMIHSPWSVAVGNADEMEAVGRLLRQVESEVVIPAYQEMGVTISDAKLASMLAEETWIGAKDAIEMGFASGYTREESEPVEALIRPGLWSSLPPQLEIAPTVSPKAVKRKLVNKAKQIQDGYTRLQLMRLRHKMQAGKIARDANLISSRLRG